MHSPEETEETARFPVGGPVVARSLPFGPPEVEAMKKIFTLLMTLTILAVVAAPSFAQGRSCRRNYDSRSYDSRSYDTRSYDSRSYDSRGYYDNSRAYYDYSDRYRGRSLWDRHRDKLSLGIGTVGGAAIGGLIGGRRGAAIGGLSGLGASALYTYKLRNRRYRY